MDICIIDFETTGVDVFKDNPIELGAILISEEWEIKAKYHSYIKPRTKRSFSISSKNIHGIEVMNLVSSPAQKEVLDDFLGTFGTDYRFAGWNINFDVSFFRRMCHNNKMMRTYNQIYHRHIDVQSIVYYLKATNKLPQNLSSLNDLAEFFSIKRSQKHNALEDAEITFNVFKNLMKSCEI